jgi:MarR family transcriptional regulator, organic hydroperoxide resistance regulator
MVELLDLDQVASEINALAILADGHGRTISELGGAAGTRRTTLTSVLDRLERRGTSRAAPARATAESWSSS